MNVSLKWLGTLVDIKGLDPEEMAETLTIDGIPVERVIYPGKGISGVVTGKILSVEKHPNADKLVICHVDVGRPDSIQIVTGANNVKEGLIVPVALDGAHVPAKHDAGTPGGLKYGDIKIKAGELRGVKSEGMMCSCSELGLDENLFPGVNKEGIMILPADTQVGGDFHTLYDLDDVIFEMELTANRADCFSMIGMALEVGAVFKRKVTLPSINVAESGMPIQGRAAVHISDARYCKRFCGRLMENIKMGRSPMWMENRLRSNGIRPINNIVDAANYVMLEIGQPLHTYDYDKVEGNELTCRFAGEKENLKTLDGVANSQVDEMGTTKPLLECITSGVIRGAVAMVGCNNPKVRPDTAHIELMKKMIANDIIIIASGCSAQAAAKAGLMDKEAKELCGAGLKRVCELADIPPVLHMGSCVDISRMMILAAELAKDSGLNISQLPVVGCAPEWMSEKAVSIGNYVVATGIDTFLGVDPYVSGSDQIAQLLTEGVRDWVEAAYTVEKDIDKLGDAMIARIEEKRTALGI